MAEPPRTVLISGCSTGIGLELAVQLAQDPRQRFQGKGPRAAEAGRGGHGFRGPPALPALAPQPIPSAACVWAWKHPLMQRIFHLPSVRHCSRCCKCSCEQHTETKTSPLGSGVMEEGREDRQ